MPSVVLCLIFESDTCTHSSSHQVRRKKKGGRWSPTIGALSFVYGEFLGEGKTEGFPFSE